MWLLVERGRGKIKKVFFCMSVSACLGMGWGGKVDDSSKNHIIVVVQKVEKNGYFDLCV